MKRVILILIFSFLTLFGANKDILNPNSEVYDFTFESNNVPLEEFSQGSYVNKISVEVDKIIGSLPRFFKTNTCGTDTYGNNYCNEALSECSQEWDYENGYSVSGVGSAMDYADKTTVTSYTSALAKHISRWKLISGGPHLFSIYYGQWVYNGNWIPNGSQYTYYGDESSFTYNTYSYNGDKCTIVNRANSGAYRYSLNYEIGAYRTEGVATSQCQVYSTEYYCSNGATPISGQCPIQTLQCPSGYTPTTGTETSKGECKKEISYSFYEYKCSDAQSSQNYNYTPQNTGGDCNKTDPNTSTVNSTTLDDACNSATPPTNNCKREKFTCVADSNRPCAKVDDKWQCSPFACNNNLECGYATCNGLPTSNTAIMPYEYHPIEALTRSGDACIPIQCDADYEYDDGIATKVDKKLCSGTVVNGKCVEYEYADKISETYTATIGQSKVGWGYLYWNGGEDSSWYYQTNGAFKVAYASLEQGGGMYGYCSQGTLVWLGGYRNDYECRETTYLCPNGGTANGTECLKISCPSGYSEYGSTTQCRKATDIGFKEYYYHTYECPTDTNAFGETWELTEPNIERGCVDDTFGGCLNFDIETQRCQRKIHTCPNGSGTCTLDGNNKYTCSYDGCDAVRYPCIGQMCDLALNDRISFCENESCPSSQIVYEEDNKCFVDVCPEGTFEDETGLCLNEDQ